MSLRMRLIALTGLLSAGTVLLFALVFYVVLQNDLLDEVDGHLRERASQVIQALKADGDLSNDNSLPPLSDVFAAYGSWKRARRAAANAA